MTNAPNLIVAVKSVTYHENHSRTVEICCPVCQSDHTHVWPLSESQIGYRAAGCNLSVGYVVQIPEWAKHRENRRSYTKYADRTTTKAGASSLNDNAIDAAANNWEE